MRLLAGAPADLVGDGYRTRRDREWAFVDAGTWLSDVLSGLRNPDTIDSGGGTARTFAARFVPTRRPDATGSGSSQP